MNEPQRGTWYRVSSGPQRGQQGVLDGVYDYAVGRRYRLSASGYCVGRFAAEQLVAIPAPRAESRLPVETQQRALDLLTKGVSS